MPEAIVVVTLLALVAGLILGLVKRYLPGDESSVTDAIDRELPQTQCGQCGFPGCRPYAEAIADDRADINLCLPGGADTVRRLAELLGRDARPLAADPKPAAGVQVARIDEDLCIGCTHCIAACPVDAIVGASQFMHSILGSECTGCELCVLPCPVDCIDMVPAR